MGSRVNYGCAAGLMGMMLLCIIILVVWVPAKNFRMSAASVNPDLRGGSADYKERKPYTDLELYGRSIYIQEGCFYCHSQQTRYQDRGMGPAAFPQEFQFDSPHLLGSARTGPDLHREGGKYPSRWHRYHHIYPRAKYAGSIMPSFRHLDEEPIVFDRSVDSVAGGIDGAELLRLTPDELRARCVRVSDTTLNPETDGKLTPEETVLELRAIGYTPYDLKKPDGRGVTRLDALVAYIQSLGPNRMYEPGQATTFADDSPRPVLDPLPQRLLRSAAAGIQAEADALEDARKPSRDELLFPRPDQGQTVDQPVDWWVPNEYQDMARKAKEDGKVPAFEPRFINNGRGIFLGKCSHCHGLNGRGDGPAGHYMLKKPANFWLPQFKHYTDAMWFYRIAEGVPGTDMPVWKYSLRQRKERQRWDQVWYLVTYLKYVAATAPTDWPEPTVAEYLTDPEAARQGIMPVNPLVVAPAAHRLELLQAADVKR